MPLTIRPPLAFQLLVALAAMPQACGGDRSTEQQERDTWCEKNGYPFFGSVLADAGDVNRDGIPDFLLADPGHSSGHRGAVWLVSGKDMATLHVAFGESVDDGFGWDVGPAGDVDLDGCKDWIVGAWHEEGASPGYAVLYSGRTGSALLRLSVPGDDSFGAAVGGAGDVDADGHPDVVVAARPTGEVDESSPDVYVLSGRDGATIHTIRFSQYPDDLVQDVEGVGDLNGDGRDDFVVGLSSASASTWQVVVCSGADASTLHMAEGNLSYAGCFQVGQAGDTDGDQCRDYFVALHDSATVYSGRTGAILWRHQDPPDGAKSFCALGDVSGDMIPDYAFGAPNTGIAQGSVYVYSGDDGSTLYSIWGPDHCWHFGNTVVVVGDIDKDGCNDYLVGADHARSHYPGRARLHSGQDGKLLAEIGRSGRSIAVQ